MQMISLSRGRLNSLLYPCETRNKNLGQEDALLLQFPWLGRKSQSRELIVFKKEKLILIDIVLKSRGVNDYDTYGKEIRGFRRRQREIKEERCLKPRLIVKEKAQNNETRKFKIFD